MKETFFGHATSIHRQKRVFYCTWLPSSGQVLQLFVQVPPNGPLNITCQKTRSPKKILTIYTKLVQIQDLQICVFINQASDPNSMDIIHAL